MVRPELLKFQKEMEEKFGKNVVRPASELESLLEVRIPTGSISLDIATGGGLPIGRFIQISGAYSTGKSSLCYHIIKNAQQMTKEVPILKKKGKEIVTEYQESPMTVMLIQSEANAWTTEYGQYLGIDVDELLFSPCAGMEEALEIAHKAQSTGLVDLIIIDSLEALIPMKEYISEMDESVQMGIKPRLFGEYFRKFQATNNRLLREDKLPCTIIGINQLREKIGAYGDNNYTPGGRAIGFTASLDIRLTKGDWISIGSGVNKQIIGQQIKFKVHKNKVGVPQKTGMFDFYFDDGGTVPRGFIDNFKEVIIEGIAYDVIQKAGAWISYKDVKVQGADNFIEILREREDLFEEIKEKLMEVALNSDNTVEDSEEDYEEGYDDE